MEPDRWPVRADRTLLRAKRLVLGLLSDLPRKNCWTIAEWAGEATPHGMQHLLCRAAWDAEAVRDDVREYVEHLHDEAAVLVVDETGDVKTGTHTVEVQRQHRHCQADRELPGRCLPRPPRRARARGGGPRTVHPALLDLRFGPLPGSGARARPALSLPFGECAHAQERIGARIPPG
jgi:hypothetical protein